MSLLGDIRGRVAWVVFGCMLCQLGLAYGYILSPLAGAMIDDLGWTRAEYGTARSVQLIGMALATPVAGFLLVRFGARPVAFVSAALMGGAVFGMSRVESLLEFTLLIAVLGVGLAGIGDVTMGAVVSRWVDRGRGKALGFVYMGSNLGGFLFVPVAAGLAASLGWRSALVHMAVGGAFVLIPIGAFLIREPTPAEAPTGSAEEGVAADPSAVVNPSAIENPSAVESPSSAEKDLDLRAALRTRSFWILAFVLFSMFFFYIAMNTHFVLFLENVGIDNQTATGWYSVAIGMGFAIKLVSGFIADLMSPKRAILIDQGLFTVTALVVTLVPATGFLQLFVITYGICTAARDIVLPLAVADCFGSKYLAEIYGVLMLTLLPGGFLGPIFAGAVADRFGSYNGAFVAFAVLNLAAFLLLLGLRRETRELA